MFFWSFAVDLVEVCHPNNCNVGLLCYSPLAGGSLSGKYLDLNSEAAKKGRMNIFPGYMERYNKSLAKVRYFWNFLRLLEKLGCITWLFWYPGSHNTLHRNSKETRSDSSSAGTRICTRSSIYDEFNHWCNFFGPIKGRHWCFLDSGAAFTSWSDGRCW